MDDLKKTANTVTDSDRTISKTDSTTSLWKIIDNTEKGPYTLV